MFMVQSMATTAYAIEAIVSRGSAQLCQAFVRSPKRLENVVKKMYLQAVDANRIRQNTYSIFIDRYCDKCLFHLSLHSSFLSSNKYAAI